MYKTWREHYSPIIAEIIQATGTDDKKKLKKALCDGFPSPPKKHWPYKVWRSEVRRQLKLDIPVLDMPLFDNTKTKGSKDGPDATVFK